MSESKQQPKAALFSKQAATFVNRNRSVHNKEMMKAARNPKLRRDEDRFIMNSPFRKNQA